MYYYLNLYWYSSSYYSGGYKTETQSIVINWSNNIFVTKLNISIIVTQTWLLINFIYIGFPLSNSLYIRVSLSLACVNHEVCIGMSGISIVVLILSCVIKGKKCLAQ